MQELTTYLSDAFANWQPKDLSHCIQSYPLSLYLVIGSSIVVILYFRIVRFFITLASLSSSDGREAWIAMGKLFGMCAMAGYGSIILVFFTPPLGIILRTLALTAVIFYSALFIQKYKGILLEMGRHEALGSRIDLMTDQELSSLSREIINMRLQKRLGGK